jgi:hypothetical protein
LNITLKVFMISPNFIQKVQMTLIFITMMTCITSHLVGVKFYFISNSLWVFQFSHISNSWLFFIDVVSKLCCNQHFHVTKMITFIIQKSLIHLHPLSATNRLGALHVQHCESSCTRVYNIICCIRLLFSKSFPKSMVIGLCYPISWLVCYPINFNICNTINITLK